MPAAEPMTQEIINRLKELLAKAPPLPWALKVHTGNGEAIEPSDDWTVRGADGNGVCFEGESIPQADANAHLIVEAINALPALLSTLTNLTPSGVERMRADPTDAMIDAGAAAVDYTNPYPQDAAANVYAAMAALALPSEPPSQDCPHCNGEGDIDDGDHPCMMCGGSGLAEPPSQGDVEGRAREIEGKPCGGCGAKSNDERCIGCLHDFGTPESAWVRQYHHAALPSKEDGRS